MDRYKIKPVSKNEYRIEKNILGSFVLWDDVKDLIKHNGADVAYSKGFDDGIEFNMKAVTNHINSECERLRDL